MRGTIFIKIFCVQSLTKMFIRNKIVFGVVNQLILHAEALPLPKRFFRPGGNSSDVRSLKTFNFIRTHFVPYKVT